MKNCKTHLIICLCMFMTVCGFAHAYDEQQALAETDAQFRSVLESVQETEAWVADAHGGLGKVRDIVARLPKGPERDAIEQQIKKVRDQLASHSKTLKRFTEHGGKVTETLDMAYALKDFHDKASQRRGGPLAMHMTYLAKLLTDKGEKVPFIGGILKKYGEVTERMLNATDKLAANIDKERNENMLGAGTYDFFFNEKQRALKKFGSDIADGGPYVPKGPSYLYRPVDERSGPILIWDDKDKEWYRIDNNDANLEKVYTDGLLIGKRYQPWELKVFGEKWADYQAREKAAAELYDKLYGIRMGSLAYIEVDQETNGELRRLINDRDRFIALYSLDQSTNTRIKELVAAIRSKAKKMEAERKADLAARRKQREEQARLSREQYLARLREDNPNGVPEGSPGTTDPIPVYQPGGSASPVDCGDISERKIAAINGRLQEAGPDMVASLSRSLFRGSEGVGLLTCICAATSSSSGTARISYNPEPVEGSPSCLDPRGGPCVNQAYGCWRHKLTITEDSLSSCSFGESVARKLCED